MKARLFHLSLCTLLITSGQAQLVGFTNEKVKAEWIKSVNDRSKLFEGKALGDGLSSTGKITVTNIYTLTHNEVIGDKGDKIALVVQEDLLGSRLLSIDIINMRAANTRKLYRTGELKDVQQADTGQSAIYPETMPKKSNKP